MWVRGLKRNTNTPPIVRVWSHPMWVRGLKPLVAFAKAYFDVAPYVGAWIETCRDARKSTWEESHPMWVRGLKPVTTNRALCNCLYVAPYVGAWIETCE